MSKCLFCYYLLLYQLILKKLLDVLSNVAVVRGSEVAGHIADYKGVVAWRNIVLVAQLGYLPLLASKLLQHSYNDEDRDQVQPLLNSHVGAPFHFVSDTE